MYQFIGLAKASVTVNLKIQMSDSFGFVSIFSRVPPQRTMDFSGNFLRLIGLAKTNSSKHKILEPLAFAAEVKAVFGLSSNSKLI